MSRPQTVARSWGNRWGELMARRARTVLAIAVVALIACGLGYMTIARYLPPADVSVTGSESARTADLMHRYFPAVGGESDLIVFSSPDRTVDDPAFRTRIDGTVRAASQHAGVAAASGPFDMFNPLAARAISPDRHAALAVLRLSADDAHQRARDADALRPVISGHSGDGIEVGLTGYSPATNDLASTEKADTARAEAIGLPVALILLILSFGAAMAAVLPLVVAGIGLVCTFGVIAALMPAMNFSALVVTIATTLGTGLAIDYALFVVSRFREELARRSITDAADREAVAEAVGAALTTAGRTITISGLIVLVTLSCLAVVNSPVFREITVGISATVVCLLIVALTALPALLGLLGPRVSRWSLPNWAIPADARLGSETPRGRWSAWARHVMARPVRYGVAAVAILAIGLIPLGSLRYGLNLGGDALAHTDSGRANTVLAQRFTPGLSGPIQVVVTGRGGAAADPGAVSRLTGRFATDNRVWAQLSQQAEGRQALVIVPAVAPDSAAAIDLVRDLRAAGADAGGIEASVGGPTAQFLDLVHETESKTAWVVGLVVALSLIFLGLAFRSVLLPIKAVIMNLLVTGAAVGLGIAVFQWGHGSSILHFTSVGYVQIYLPVTVFCVLFGLSMDYEVFLLGRIREEWERGDPALPASVRNEQAVAAGIEHTARPITAAAAIMVVILLSLLTADVLELKQFGLAIAAAIAADALLVRLVLVPAFMKLVGGANWWPGSRGVRAGTAPAPVESMVP